MDAAARKRLEEEIFGPDPEPPPALDGRALDEIFASKTHVRVLRVLALLGGRINLSARDIARRAGISHVRVLQVLPALASARVVQAHVAPTHSIYEMGDEHPLQPILTALFELEAEISRASG